MSDVVNFPTSNPDRHNRDLLEMLEGLVEQARQGHILGLAFIEHRRDGSVAFSISRAPEYHHINSGAARLAHFLAGLANK
jgi:hypothetical protein